MRALVFVAAALATAAIAGPKEPMKYDPKLNVQRHPNGALWVGIAAEKQTVAGIAIPKDTVVTFREDGTLEALAFPEDWPWGNFTWAADEDVSFDEKGRVTGGTSAKEFTANGLTFAKGKTVEFVPWKPGTGAPSVVRGVLAGAQKWNGLTLKADSEVQLEGGKLANAVAGEDTKYKGVVEVKAGNQLTFHPNGMVSSITNDWGVGFFDEKGREKGHKQFAR